MASMLSISGASGAVGTVSSARSLSSAQQPHALGQSRSTSLSAPQALARSPVMGDLRLEPFAHPPTVSIGNASVGNVATGLVRAVNPTSKAVTLSTEPIQQAGTFWSIALLSQDDVDAHACQDDAGPSASAGLSSVQVRPDGGFAFIRVTWAPEKEGKVRQNFWFRINGKSRTNVFVLGSAVSAAAAARGSSAPAPKPLPLASTMSPGRAARAVAVGLLTGKPGLKSQAAAAQQPRAASANAAVSNVSSSPSNPRKAFASKQLNATAATAPMPTAADADELPQPQPQRPQAPPAAVAERGRKHPAGLKAKDGEENVVVLLPAAKPAPASSSSDNGTSAGCGGGPPASFLARMAAHAQAREDKQWRLEEERQLAKALEEEKAAASAVLARSKGVANGSKASRSQSRDKPASVPAEAGRAGSKSAAARRPPSPEIQIFAPKQPFPRPAPAPVAATEAAPLQPALLPGLRPAAEAEANAEGIVEAQPRPLDEPLPTAIADVGGRPINGCSRLKARLARGQLEQAERPVAAEPADSSSSSSSFALSFSPPPTMAAWRKRAEAGDRDRRRAQSQQSSLMRSAADDGTSIEIYCGPSAASSSLSSSSSLLTTGNPSASIEAPASQPSAAKNDGAGEQPPRSAAKPRALKAAALPPAGFSLAFSPPVAPNSKRARQAAAAHDKSVAERRMAKAASGACLSWVIDAKTLPSALPLLPASAASSPAAGNAASTTEPVHARPASSPEDIAVATSLAGAKKRRLAALCGLLPPPPLPATEGTDASFSSTFSALPKGPAAASPSAAVLAWRVSLGGLLGGARKAAAHSAKKSAVKQPKGPSSASSSAWEIPTSPLASMASPAATHSGAPGRKQKKLLANIEQRRRLALLLKSQEQPDIVTPEAKEGPKPAAGTKSARFGQASAASSATSRALAVPVPIRTDPSVHAHQIASALSAWLTAALTGNHQLGAARDGLDDDDDVNAGAHSLNGESGLEPIDDASSYEVLAYQQMLAPSTSAADNVTSSSPRLLALKRREARSKLAAFKLLHSHTYYVATKQQQQPQVLSSRGAAAGASNAVLKNGIRLGTSAVGPSSSASLAVTGRRDAHPEENLGLAGIREQVQGAIEDGRISLRQGNDSWQDLGIRASVADLLLTSYQPEWLKLGLETVVGENITIAHPQQGKRLKAAEASANEKAAVPTSGQPSPLSQGASPASSAQSHEASAPASSFTKGLLRALKPAARSKTVPASKAKPKPLKRSARAVSAAPASASTAQPPASHSSSVTSAAPAAPLSRKQMKAAFEAAIRRCIIHKLCAPTLPRARAALGRGETVKRSASSSAGERTAVTSAAAKAQVRRGSSVAAHAHLTTQASEKQYNALHAQALVKRVLSLVIFLDAAHAAGVLSSGSGRSSGIATHNQPCLFKPSSLFKSTESVVTALATGSPGNGIHFRMVHAGQRDGEGSHGAAASLQGIGLLKCEASRRAGSGNLVDFLSSLGLRYRVRQHRMDEYDWPSRSGDSLATDLRDGVRLMRLVEVLAALNTAGHGAPFVEPLQLCKSLLRLPAPTRTNRLHNVEAALKTAHSYLSLDATGHGCDLSKQGILKAIDAALGSESASSKSRSRSTVPSSSASLVASSQPRAAKSSPPTRLQPSALSDPQPLNGLAALFAERQRRRAAAKASLQPAETAPENAAQTSMATARSSFIGRRSIYSKPASVSAAKDVLSPRSQGNRELERVNSKGSLSMPSKLALIQQELRSPSDLTPGCLRTPFGVKAKDLVDGHAAKTMSLLWTMLSHGAGGALHPLLSVASANDRFYYLDRLSKETAMLKRRHAAVTEVMAAHGNRLQPVCAPAGFASIHAPFAPGTQGLTSSDVTVSVPVAVSVDIEAAQPSSRRAMRVKKAPKQDNAVAANLCPSCLGVTDRSQLSSCGLQEGACVECSTAKASSVLLGWAQAVAAAASSAPAATSAGLIGKPFAAPAPIKVTDADLSFADGRAIASLIAFYHPEALSRSSIQHKTVMSSLLASSTPANGALLLKSGATRTFYHTAASSSSLGQRQKKKSVRARLFERLRGGNGRKLKAADNASSTPATEPAGRKTSLLHLALEAEAHNWQLIAKASRFLGIPKAAYSAFIRVPEPVAAAVASKEFDGSKDQAQERSANIFAPRKVVDGSAKKESAVPTVPTSSLPRTTNSLCPPSPVALHYLLSCLAIRLLDTSAELKACLVIQRAWRTVLARRQAKLNASLLVIRTKIASRVVGRWYRYQMLPGLAARDERRRREKAAAVIQLAFSKYMQRKAAMVAAAKKAEARALFASRLRAMAQGEAEKAVALAAKRGVADKARLALLSQTAAEFAERNCAIVFIQAAARGWLARRRMAKGLSAVVKVQALFRAYLETRRLVAFSDEPTGPRRVYIRVDVPMMKGAAIMIQSAFRGSLARVSYLRLRRAVLSLQTAFRKRTARAHDSLARQTAAAVVVQRCVRRWIARSLMQLRHAAASMIAATWRMHRAEERYCALRFAVVSLQMRFRIRRDARAIRIAAVASANKEIAAKLQQVASQLPAAGATTPLGSGHAVSTWLLPASPASAPPTAHGTPASSSAGGRAGFLLDVDVSVPLPPRLSLSLGVRFTPSAGAGPKTSMPSAAANSSASSASGSRCPKPPLPSSANSSKPSAGPTPASTEQANSDDARLLLRRSAEAARRRLSIGGVEADGIATTQAADASFFARAAHEQEDAPEEEVVTPRKAAGGDGDETESFATPKSDKGPSKARRAKGDEEQEKETAAAAQRQKAGARKAQRVPVASVEAREPYFKPVVAKPVATSAQPSSQLHLQRQWKMAAAGKVVSRFVAMASARIRFMRMRRACVIMQRFAKWCALKVQEELELGARALIASAMAHYFRRWKLLAALSNPAGNVFRFVVRPGFVRLQALWRGAAARSLLLDMVGAVDMIETWWRGVKARRSILAKVKAIAAASLDAKRKAQAKERLKGRREAAAPALVAAVSSTAAVAGAVTVSSPQAVMRPAPSPETTVKKGPRRGFANGDSDDEGNEEACGVERPAALRHRAIAANFPVAVAAPPAMVADEAITEEDVAAMMIQSCWRGYLARQNYRLYRYMVTSIQRAWRCYVARSFFVAHYQPIAAANSRRVTLPNRDKIGFAPCGKGSLVPLEDRQQRALSRAAQSTLVERLLSKGLYSSPDKQDDRRQARKQQLVLSTVFENSAEDKDDSTTPGGSPLKEAQSSAEKLFHDAQSGPLDDSQVILRLQLQELETSKLMQQLSPPAPLEIQPAAARSSHAAKSTARSVVGARTPATVSQLLAMNSSFADHADHGPENDVGDDDEQFIGACAALIQACWRGYVTRLAYRSIVTSREVAMGLLVPWLAAAIKRWKLQRERGTSPRAGHAVSRCSFLRFKKAVTKAQAAWRGYVVRRARTPEVTVAADRIAIATRDAAAGVTLTLGRRTAAALRVLATSRQLTRILAAVAELEVATRLSPLCVAACVSIGIPPALFALMRACRRSYASHTTLARKAIGVLRNIIAVPATVIVKGGLTRDAVATGAAMSKGKSAAAAGSTSSSKYAHVVAGSIAAEGVSTLVGLLQTYRDDLAVVRPALDFLFSMARLSRRVRRALAGEGLEEAALSAGASAASAEVLPTESMRKVAGLRSFYARKAEQVTQLQIRARLEQEKGQPEKAAPAASQFDSTTGISTGGFTVAGTCREYNRLLGLLRLHLAKEKEEREARVAKKAAKGGKGKKGGQGVPAALLPAATPAVPNAAAAAVAAQDPLMAGIALERTPEDFMAPGAQGPSRRARQPHDNHTATAMRTRSQTKSFDPPAPPALSAASAPAVNTVLPILANPMSARKRVPGRGVTFNVPAAAEAATATGAALPAAAPLGLPPKSPGRRAGTGAVPQPAIPAAGAAGGAGIARALRFADEE